MISISVPGKLMLSGEYAVLRGGTAVLVPISRYLTVAESLVADSSRQSPVIRAALAFPIEETEKFERDHGLPCVSIDYTGFSHRDSSRKTVKLGIGSSAAEAVGIVALRFERAGLAWSKNRNKIASYAHTIHRQAQGGIGSGADTALCAFREPIEYTMGHGPHPIEFEPKTDIPLHAVWSEHPSDTRKMVADFESWLSRGEPAAAALLSRLVESSRELADTWFRTPQDILFQQLDRFCSALHTCMEAAAIQYRLPIHHELESWAEKQGGRAKPTGAGGGDMILLVGDLPVSELGMTVIPLHT
jgi:phosphomevalonate kinase